MTAERQLPRFLPFVNRIMVGLQRLGLSIGPVQSLSVPGRKSGALRTTPVSPFVVAGQRYVMAGQDSADWARNARAAGWGVLARGRKRERVALTELPSAERGPILREFPRLVPGGVAFIRGLYGLPTDPAALPDAFAALAPRCPVFRVDPAPEGR